MKMGRWTLRLGVWREEEEGIRLKGEQIVILYLVDSLAPVCSKMMYIYGMEKVYCRNHKDNSSMSYLFKFSQHGEIKVGLIGIRNLFWMPKIPPSLIEVLPPTTIFLSLPFPKSFHQPRRNFMITWHSYLAPLIFYYTGISFSRAPYLCMAEFQFEKIDQLLKQTKHHLLSSVWPKLQACILFILYRLELLDLGQSFISLTFGLPVL
jgi:hypothetical protein